MTRKQQHPPAKDDPQEEAPVGELSQGSILYNEFIVDKKIGSGAFGNVYKGFLTNGDPVAIKVESVQPKKSRLHIENDIYKKINGTGVPKVFHYDDKDKILVMSFLGPSLENLFDFCNRRFSLKTTCMIGIQCVRIIEHIHSKGYIHRDIKPDNFLIGVGSNRSKIFIVDFGLSKPYLEETSHIEYRNNKNFTGTYRYSSIRNHKGIEQSRRDDLEAIGYMLVYFLQGKLPWQGLRISEKSKRNKEIYKKKRTTSLKDLCEGLPDGFYEYLRYCRLLRFTATPDYDYLQNIFIHILTSENKIFDHNYDWNKLARAKRRVLMD